MQKDCKMATTNPISITKNKSSENHDTNNSEGVSLFTSGNLFSPNIPCPPEVSLMDRMEEMNLIIKREKTHNNEKK